MSGEVRPPNRSLTAIDGAIALISVLLVVQMWLLTATLESYLAGHHGAALPGAILSGALFAAGFSLYVFIEKADRARARSGPSSSPARRAG